MQDLLRWRRRPTTARRWRRPAARCAWAAASRRAGRCACARPSERPACTASADVRHGARCVGAPHRRRAPDVAGFASGAPARVGGSGRARRDHGLRPGRLDARRSPRRPRAHRSPSIDQESRRVPPAAGRRSAAARSPASASTARPWSRPASSDADAFAAVSSGDNSNIIAARVARETFGVENVVARIYDPAPRRGLPAARHPDRRHRPLDRRPDAAPAAARRGRAGVAATRAARCGSPRCTWTPAWIGQPRAPASRSRRRHGSPSSPASARACCPTAETVLQEGDLVHVLVRAERRSPTSSAALGRAPPREEH